MSEPPMDNGPHCDCCWEMEQLKRERDNAVIKASSADYKYELEVGEHVATRRKLDETRAELEHLCDEDLHAECAKQLETERYKRERDEARAEVERLESTLDGYRQVMPENADLCLENGELRERVRVLGLALRNLTSTCEASRRTVHIGYEHDKYALSYPSGKDNPVKAARIALDATETPQRWRCSRNCCTPGGCLDFDPDAEIGQPKHDN